MRAPITAGVVIATDYRRPTRVAYHVPTYITSSYPFSLNVDAFVNITFTLNLRGFRAYRMVPPAGFAILP